jgi:hypothetical protein
VKVSGSCRAAPLKWKILSGALLHWNSEGLDDESVAKSR